MALIGTKEDSTIGELILRDVEQVNLLGQPIPLVQNDGAIGKLHLTNVDTGEDSLLVWLLARVILKETA